jgi:hypothetical protein
MTEGNRLGELAERILARCVATESGCLEWPGAHHPKGYGQIGFRSKLFATHRVAYEAAKGPIPPGYQIDHLCRNPSCCNADHLEAVTPRENTRRGKAGLHHALKQRAKTHCPRGHPYDAENTYVCKRGKRSCKRCAIERQRVRRAAA